MNRAKIFANVLVMTLAIQATAIADTSETKVVKRPKVLMAGIPVNPNLAGGGTVPKGVLYTALNPIFSNKDRSQDGFQGPDTFSQSWILKLRYGLTNHLELSTTLSYINLSRSDPTPAVKHLEGYGDQLVYLNYAFYNIHQGDPFALSVSAGALLPTAPEGNNHLPGYAAWGGRGSIDFGKFLTPDIKFDTSLVVSSPFERGNQDVKRGEQYQWNTALRYLFNTFDIALESSLVATVSGDKSAPAGNIDLHNGSREWFVGPSMNFVIDRYDMWFGIGLFFPVWQDNDSPAMVEDYQLAFKIGKLW